MSIHRLSKIIVLFFIQVGGLTSIASISTLSISFTSLKVLLDSLDYPFEGVYAGPFITMHEKYCKAIVYNGVDSIP